jgi:hypothetical protein
MLSFASIIAPLQEPLLAPLAAQRSVAACLAGAGIAQLGLNLAGLPGWRCPFRAVTGLPCPGCGLTGAIELLLRGQVSASLHAHAFAPFFLAAILLFFILALLPASWRGRCISRLERIERRTGLAAWVLLSLMFYWGLRLAHLA